MTDVRKRKMLIIFVFNVNSLVAYDMNF